MKAYVDDIIVTDASGEKAVLYPRTKQEAVFGLMERLGKLEAPHITETEATTMENSYAGRLEIVNIGGGESEQDKTTGAQLFDGALEQGSFDGVLNKIESAYRVRNSVNRPVAPNKTYTIFSRVAKEASIFELDSEGNFLRILSSFASLPLTFTTSNDAGFIAFVLRIGDTTAITPNMVNDVMLNEGTEALPWEPYTGGLPAPNPDYPQEIKKSVVSEIRTHGKNLLKNNHEPESSSNGITFVTNDDGTVTINGTATADTQYNIVSEDIPVQDGMYFNLVKLSGSFTGTINHVAFTKNYTNGSPTPLGTPKKLNASVKYERFRMAINSGTVCNNLVVGFILSKDANDTFEPYTESVITLSQPIELYGIGDVQDVIEDGKVKRKFGSVIFDGSDDENWTIATTVDESKKRLITTDITNSAKKPIGNNDVANSLCTQANPIGNQDTYDTVEGFAITTTGKVAFYSQQFNTEDISLWKAHLQDNPMTVVYELAEDAIEELPIADQIALNSLSTYDGITYAEVVSDIPPTFKGKYGTSEVGGMVLEGKLAGLNGELYGISNADRIAALEASVVNNI